MVLKITKTLAAENLLVGTNCNDIRDGYFSYPIKRHLVFYKIESEMLNIVRVLGVEMDHVEHLKGVI